MKAYKVVYENTVINTLKRINVKYRPLLEYQNQTKNQYEQKYTFISISDTKLSVYGAQNLF